MDNFRTSQTRNGSSSPDMARAQRWLFRSESRESPESCTTSFPTVFLGSRRDTAFTSNINEYRFVNSFYRFSKKSAGNYVDSKRDNFSKRILNSKPDPAQNLTRTQFWKSAIQFTRPKKYRETSIQYGSKDLPSWLPIPNQIRFIWQSSTRKRQANWVESPTTSVNCRRRQRWECTKNRSRYLGRDRKAKSCGRCS